MISYTAYHNKIMAAFKTHVTVGLFTGYIAGAFTFIVLGHIVHVSPICILAAAFIGTTLF